MASITVDEAKGLICDVCGIMYNHGWVGGTGGGMSIKAGDRIVMAPSGVQKERMKPGDMFVLDSAGNILQLPEIPPANGKAPKLSECAPLFQAAYELRNAGAVVHSHSINAVLATMLDPAASEFRVTQLEMIKGIPGQGFYGTLVVPIIENTARECELTDRLREAIIAYPESNAVLVRRHGVYVWGSSWVQAKTQAESYDYLFEAALKMRSMGIDASRAPASTPVANGHAHGDGGHISKKAKRPSAIVLDIEGTVAPISFVTEVLFPYAKARLRSHLQTTYDTAETQADIDGLRQQAAQDAQAGQDVVHIPEASAAPAEVIRCAVLNAEAQMALDRKTACLKNLQGHIWRQGFLGGEIKSELFPDVPDALAAWHDAGIKVYIYSSGSRGAQRDLFAHTQAGDMRPHLSGFFDTSSGPKVEAASYKDIALSLGTNWPSDILFATDVITEARAARAAGWTAVVVARPGNAPLPADCEFPVVETMQELFDV